MHTPASVFKAWSATHVIVGSSSSVTVISKVHVVAFPAPSVAVHSTVVVPKLNGTPFKDVPVPEVAPESA